MALCISAGVRRLLLLPPLQPLLLFQLISPLPGQLGSFSCLYSLRVHNGALPYHPLAGQNLPCPARCYSIILQGLQPGICLSVWV
jgi:hypothetical protein